MIGFFKKIVRWFAAFDAHWQNLWMAVLAALLILNQLVVLPTRFENFELAVGVLIPTLFVISVLLRFASFLLRKQQISLEEIQAFSDYFRSARELEQLFIERVAIRRGRVEMRKELPVFKSLRFAENSSDVASISEINRVAFLRSLWADGKESKIRRNTEFWERNPLTFMCMSSPFNDDGGVDRPFFFSCVLPMSEIGFHRYFIDRIAGDNDFQDDWIAAPGEEAHCVLLFTFARHLDWAREALGTDHVKMLPYYFLSVGVHLQRILAAHFPKGKMVSVYFQNGDSSFERIAKMLGMGASQLRSKDDEPVYVTSICDKAYK